MLNWKEEATTAHTNQNSLEKGAGVGNGSQACAASHQQRHTRNMSIVLRREVEHYKSIRRRMAEEPVARVAEGVGLWKTAKNRIEDHRKLEEWFK